MPGRDDDWEAFTSLSLALLGTPMLSNQLLILWIIEVHLAWSTVLKLWVINGLLWQHSASEAENTPDVEVWLSTNHVELTKGMLSEVVESLEESSEQVLKLVQNLSLATELLVAHIPEGVALRVELLSELVHGAASLVWVVDIEGLEVEEVPWGWWEGIEWVAFLLLLLSWLGGSGWLWCLLLLLLLGLCSLRLSLKFVWLEWLGTWLNEAKDPSEGRHASDPGEPLGHVAHGLLEASVQTGLEGDDQHGG